MKKLARTNHFDSLAIGQRVGHSPPRHRSSGLGLVASKLDRNACASPPGYPAGPGGQRFEEPTTATRVQIDLGECASFRASSGTRCLA